MSKHINIPLSKAPLLLHFIEQILQFDGHLKIECDFANEFFIVGRCECSQKNCSTVYLKRDAAWNEEVLGSSQIIDTSKGMVIFYCGHNGILEVEALLYNFFPYRYELDRIFSNDFTPASKNEKAAFRRYFKELKNGNMQTIVIDD